MAFFIFASYIAGLKNSIKAHLALLGTNIFFALNFTGVKHLINNGHIQPFALNVVRVGVSMILLWILFIFKPEKKLIRKEDWGRLILCALTGIAINQLLFLKGLSMTWSIHASLLMLTTPILITVIAAWLLKEGMNILKVAGLTSGLLGAVLLISGKQESGDATQVLLGDILIILNAISYTFYFILVKPLMNKYEPIVVIRSIFTLGFLVILPFGWNEMNEVKWAEYDLTAWLVLGMIVLCGTFLAYLFNVYGIKILGASMAGTYIYSQPVFATIVAMIVLDEKLSLTSIISAILIFAGVYLTNKANNARIHNRPK